MAWIKRNPLLAAVLGLLLLAISAGGWFWWDAAAQAKKARAALAQKTQERDWLARQSPALSVENADALAADVAALEKNLTELRTALAGKDDTVAATPVPAKAIDVFFDIAAFVERTRALAARAQVVIKPDERFGFASHANEGPEADLIPAVFRQRLLAQLLIESLIESRPRALLSVQRERPLSAAARAARNQPVDPSGTAGAASTATASASGGQAADFFELEPTLSVRVPGRVESDAFRVEFTGQTPSLRALLNSLATARVPVVVRSVTVEPLRNEALPPIGDAEEKPAANSPVPLVTQNFSKFAVVVEFIVLVAAPQPVAP